MNRWFTSGALLAYLLAVLAFVASDDTVFGNRSVFASGDDGSSRAYAYLIEQIETASGPRSVDTLHRRIAPGEIAADTVILRIGTGPERLEEEVAEAVRDNPPDEDGKTYDSETEDAEAGAAQAEDAQAEDVAVDNAESEVTELALSGDQHVESLLTPREARWLAGGGRLVWLLTESVPPPLITGIAVDDQLDAVMPGWSADLAPPVERILERPRTLIGHSLVLLGGETLIGRRPYGEGELIFIASGEMFANQHLDHPGHLALLTRLTAGRPVLFDETRHGQASSVGLAYLLRHAGLGPAALLGALVAWLAFWRAGRRLGPPDADPEDTRSEAVDMVDSLAQLYGRTLSPGHAIERWYAALVDATARRTGASGDALQHKVDQLTSGMPPPPDAVSTVSVSTAAAKRMLHTINDAFRRLDDERQSRGRRSVD
ncbi:MAG: hypothetical protein AAGD38_11500 [Acidobacteriota bacterium]